MTHGSKQGHVEPMTQQDAMRKQGEKQRRLELEKEVADLQNVLQNEEKVHEVLQRALLSQSIQSKLHIPSFLPKKAKELLAELVMVEEEIARLEDDISKIKHTLGEPDGSEIQQKFQHQALPHSSTYRHEVQSLRPLLGHSSPPSTAETKANARGQRPTLETGPMFFINQAIKGDYQIHDFISKKKNENWIETNVGKSEQQKKVVVQERVPKRSGLTEPLFSPKLLTKPPRPEKEKGEPELVTGNSKYLSPTSSLTDKGQRWQPNKLSERIIKCFICIFLRLLRTSRTLELEKSGNLSRSAHFSPSFRSLQWEGNLNAKARNDTPREASQRDPYGIFDIEDSLARDIGPYKNLVRFTSSSQDLKSLPSFIPLLSESRTLMNSLQELDLRFLSHQQKLAFWINAYNICIMHGLMEHGFFSNSEKANFFRNKVFLNIGAHKLSAQVIEHFILRQPSNAGGANYKEDIDIQAEDLRSLYGLDHPEGNIAFALCNGNKSSPAVRIYTAENVLTELEKAKLEYLQASIVVTSTKRVMIPKLLMWNINDFAENLESLVDWICKQLPTSGSLRKSIAECLRFQQGNRKISEFVDILSFDFEFQYLLPM